MGGILLWGAFTIYLSLQISLGTCKPSRCSSGVQLKKPFRIIWNSPMHKCPIQSIPDLGLDQFGIEFNPANVWQGPVISLFYEKRFGRWPMVYNNGTLVNGGIPPMGNLTQHLEDIEANINTILPDRYFQGLGVIDLETNRPLWRGHSDEMKRIADISKKFNASDAAKFFSSYRDDKAKYENTSRFFFVQTLRKLHEMRPKGKWGYFGYPFCAKTHFDDYKCDKENARANDKMSWIIGESSVIYPNAYMRRNEIPDPDQRAIYSLKRMIEGIRLSKTRPGGSIPVYAYGRYVYANEKTSTFLYDYDMKSSLAMAADVGLDGFVFWGSWYENLSCQQLKEYIHTTLGPLSLRIINDASLCSAVMCYGNGKCVKSEFNRLTPLNSTQLKAYIGKTIHSETRWKHQFWVGDRLRFLNYDCQCYEGWKGPSCDVSV